MGDGVVVVSRWSDRFRPGWLKRFLFSFHGSDLMGLRHSGFGLVLAGMCFALIGLTALLRLQSIIWVFAALALLGGAVIDGIVCTVVASRLRARGDLISDGRSGEKPSHARPRDGRKKPRLMRTAKSRKR